VSYSTIYDAATTAGSPLRKQVIVAINQAAVDIVNEAIGTQNHRARLTWAWLILNGKTELADAAERWIWRVLDNATIQASPATATDSDVQFVVNSLVDVMVKSKTG
jgi:hypothetical protein